jgi:hypothetical protein
MESYSSIRKRHNITETDPACINCKHIRINIASGVGVICILKEGTLRERQVKSFGDKCSKFELG